MIHTSNTFRKIVTVLLLLLSLSFTACMQSYSNGFRIGVVNKFSNKGYTFKTWEGEMNLGGFRANGDGGVVANLWEFSIDGIHVRHEDTELLVKQLTEAAESGKPVKIFYVQDVCFCPDRGETGYFVQKVEFLP